MAERSVFDWAKEYQEKGYSVIPIEAGGKKPVIKWQKYQKERATLDELKTWFAGDTEKRNLAVVTGSISDLLVLDFDYRHGGDEARQRLSPMVADSVRSVHTGGGGIHLYYRYTGSGVGNGAGILPGFDTRGEGGYVLAPPSVTVDQYTFDKGQGIPEPKCLPRIPDEILKIILFKKKVDGPKDTKVSSKAGSFMQLQFLPATEGQRNATAARVAGSIARCCCSYSRGLEVLRLWNHTECVPPLGGPELESVWSSIWKRNGGS